MIIPFQELLLLLLLRPAKALTIAYWFLTRRRVRARLQFREAVAALPFAYAFWARKWAHADRNALMPVPPAGSPLEGGDDGPITVHIHIVQKTSPEELTRAVTSVTEQVWPHWRLLVTSHDGSTPGLPSDQRITILDGTYPSDTTGLLAALTAADTDYLVPLRPDCRLSRTALIAYVAHLRSKLARSQAIIYGDQDEIDRNGRRTKPWFKPGWDPEMFLAQDYLSAACAVPVARALDAIRAMREQTAGPAVYCLLLGMTTRSGQDVEHLHRVVVSTPPDFWCRPCEERLALLRETLIASHGAEVLPGPFGTASVRWPLPVPAPLVTVIIPTRDRLDLLRTCVEGVLQLTRYPEFEILIADNGSVEPATLKFLNNITTEARVRVVSWPHPYNYSAINNFAADAARGTYLCLLNNDIEIINGDWLSELMRYATRPQAGAVGARLFYPDLSIQHAGVVVGLGNAAGHAHRGLPKDDPGYFAHALVARRSTAVTAACLVVRRDKFEMVGGLDEINLRIAYNDVDLCLKLHQAGAANYYVPSAMLVHHESKSRGLDTAPEHIARYTLELKALQERWGTQTFIDQTHHPMLDRGSEIYKPAFPPPAKPVRHSP